MEPILFCARRSNSGHFSGLPSEEGKKTEEDLLEERGIGKGAGYTISLRDWLISPRHSATREHLFP